jgi:hypothetical protein
MTRIDREGVPARRGSGNYAVRHHGRAYPPKLLVSVACELATGRPLPSHRFSGGRETNARLAQLGFRVVRKPAKRTAARSGQTHRARSLSPRKLRALATTLVETAPLWTWSRLKSNPTVPPRSPGVYAWFFRRLPRDVPTRGCVRRGGRTLLYVGISPTSTESSETLRSRIHYHFRGNAEGSTLRRTLGCLLESTLGTCLRRVGSGRRRTLGRKESVLTQWMSRNAAVAWVETREPRLLERHLIQTLSLPLNIDGNRVHPFHAHLRALRDAARRRAAALPVLSSG